MTITYATKKDAIICNNYLTKLIQDEKKYDENINEMCIVNSLYEKFYDKDDICLLVAKQQNKIIGYLYGFIVNNGDSVIHKISQIDAIYVDEAYRTRGIAKELINKFKKWSFDKKVKYIELKVCKANVIAKKLYEKVGFHNTKIIMSLKMEAKNETI